MMKKSKNPICVFWDDTVTIEQQKFIKKTILELLASIELDASNLRIYGNYKFNIDGVKSQSFETILTQACIPQQNQVFWEKFVSFVFTKLPNSVLQEFIIIFTNRDILSNTNGILYGAADSKLTLISFKRFVNKKEIIKTLIFHEVGHILGLPSMRRGEENLAKIIGWHCINPGCSMKQGMNIPEWQENTKSRLQQGAFPYCKECMEDLHQLFN